MTSTIVYLGNLRTECTHVRSGQTIITDAPPDNNGKGEAFSPTDLAATSLGTCMVTIMGIAANNHNINIDQTRLEITKHMASDPRRIAAIDVNIIFPGIQYSKKDKKILEVAGRTCPVALSLHPDIQQNITFVWPDMDNA
ncbi:MAG TPA: OsmC family protein [Saprospiraceae bacterium]|jgi:putative redox protein|nr:OsmC family protein [Saprospiraceae bacterium]HRO08049.1 OsmC family protein [Saprospiraceae bacterium]HRP41364.1 OsmC family protein [Saprospiraceae bacterium]